MFIYDEILSILDQEILVFSLHEDFIPHIHVGASKHYIAHFKVHYI